MKLLRSFLPILFIGVFTTTVNAQEITAFSTFFGEHFYQDKEKIGWKQVESLMETNPTALKHWKTSKKQFMGAFAAQTANLGFGIWYLVNDNNDKSTTAPIIGFAGTAVVGSIFYYLSSKSKKNAILEYNDGLDKKTTFKLMPTSNENGVGLALKF